MIVTIVSKILDRNTYILNLINDSQYNFLLISKDMSRLHEYISSVEDDLKKYNSESFILFDLLLNNNIDDRFYKCYFDGNKFLLSTLSRVHENELNINLIRFSSNYYLNNEHLFEDMFFTNDYKKLILDNLQMLSSI